MNFGERIISARKKAGMTREELSELLGIKYHTLSKYEQSTREPDFETLVQIANALHVSTDYVLGYTGHQQHLKQKRLKEDTEGLWLTYEKLSDDAKARIRNQIFFEYSQQKP